MSKKRAPLENKYSSSSSNSDVEMAENLKNIAKSRRILSNAAMVVNHGIKSKVKISDVARQEEVEIFFTKERKFLDQYYELREKSFREVDERYCRKHPQFCQDWEEYDGSENVDDLKGSILVAVDSNGRVVGGMRCLISNWVENTLNEEDNFTIRNMLKTLGFNYKARYSEVDDVVVDRVYRDRTLVTKMFATLIKHSIDRGCEFIIGIAILSASRNHKMVVGSLGYHMQIVKDYPWISQKNHGYEVRYPLVTFLKKE